jgi:hypothetical protein
MTNMRNAKGINGHSQNHASGSVNGHWCAGQVNHQTPNGMMMSQPTMRQTSSRSRRRRIAIRSWTVAGVGSGMSADSSQAQALTQGILGVSGG